MLEDALSGLTEGVVLFDADGRLVVSNPAFRTMANHLGDFLAPGTSWDIFLREAGNRAVFPLETCKRLAVIEADLLAQPEDTHHVKYASTLGNFVIRMAASSDGGFILTQTETQDSEGNSDRDREVEILLGKVLEACPASLTMSRVGDGQIIYRSPAARALLGASKSQFSHFSNRADRADFITALLPDARVDDMRVTGVRADGTEFPASLSARLIEYRGEDVIVSNMEDLTSILAVQAELAQQRSQVFQAEKMSALGELLAGVAHELNNPLSIIVGNTEMLKEDLQDSGHTARIDKLSTAADRCVKIVRSFLSMARHEALNPQQTAAQTIVANAQEALSALATDAGVEILSELPECMPDLMVDEVQITQVMINLFTNSVHAMRDSGTGNKISVEGDTDPKDGMISLVVSDNGPGIDAAIVSRIFDPLFTTKDVGEGTGVGLSYCHRVVSAHGGSIEFAPVNDIGASFRVTLPALDRG